MPGGLLAAARAALVHAAVRLEDTGLNHNSAGNVSLRVGPSVLVTPTGIPAGELVPSDGVLLDMTGRQIGGHRRPTSEWQLHVEIMTRRPDISAIIHTHSPEATAASTLRRTVPAVHYVAARFIAPPPKDRGRVPPAGLACAPYATYGSADLASAAANTLGEHGLACLMANHGAVVLAGDLDAGVALALDVEWFCAVHRRALQLGGPVLLSDAEIARVGHRFTTYGQPLSSND